MTIHLLQRAKFALLYSKQPVIVGEPEEACDEYMFVGSRNAETPLCQPASFDLHGLRVSTEMPTSAAHAAKINERVDEIMAHETINALTP